MPLNPPLCCFISFFRTCDAYQVLNYHQPESMWCVCVCLDWFLWQRQADNREIKVSHSRSAVNRRLGKGERGHRGMGTDWLENMVRIDRGMHDRSDKWMKSKRRWWFFSPSQFQDGVWSLNMTVCDGLMTMDVMLCTASIFNLCAISIDRWVWHRAVAQVVSVRYYRELKLKPLNCNSVWTESEW